MIKQVVNISLKLKRPRTKLEILAKATEELGEVATMVNKPSKEFKETIQEECCDVINAVVDLAWVDYRAKHPELSDKEAVIAFKKDMKTYQKKKLNKWFSNYQKHHKGE